MPEVNYRSGLGTGAFLSIMVGEYFECDDSDFTFAASVCAFICYFYTPRILNLGAVHIVMCSRMLYIHGVFHG